MAEQKPNPFGDKTKTPEEVKAFADAENARVKAEAAADAARKEQEAAKFNASLVKMKRESMPSDVAHMPQEADVHPDEVSNYSAGGWVKV